MDTASQWPQDVVMKPMENISATCPKPCSVERKVRPHKEQSLNCPRCNSTNTKFCYYNNYSLSQPRYFCKTCRRYWTDGGSLRSIPVGGGSRKNKRSSSSLSNYTSSKKIPDIPLPQQPQQQNPKINNILETAHDLNLGFSIHQVDQDHHHHHADLKTITGMIQVPNTENNPRFRQLGSSLELENPNSSPLELLTGGTRTASRGFNSFTFFPSPLVDANASAADFGSSGFSNLPEFKLSSLNFDHGFGGNYGSFQGVNEDNKLLFPFEDLKQDHSSSNNTNDQQNRENRNGDLNSAGGYWDGVIGGGSW